MIKQIYFRILSSKIKASKHFKSFKRQKMNVKIQGKANNDLRSTALDDLVNLSRMAAKVMNKHLALAVKSARRQSPDSNVPIQQSHYGIFIVVTKVNRGDRDLFFSDISNLRSEGQFLKRKEMHILQRPQIQQIVFDDISVAFVPFKFVLRLN